MGKSFRWITFSLILSILCVRLLMADTPSEGPIDVREGDSWTRVTIVKREGRRTQIKYDDGTLEWVGPERLRVVPSGGNIPTDTPVDKPSDPAGDKTLTLDGPKTKISLDTVQTYKKPTGASVAIRPTTKPSAAFTVIKPKEDAIGVGKVTQLLPVGGTLGLVAALGEGDREHAQLALINTTTPDPFEVRVLPFRQDLFVGVADAGRMVVSKEEGFFDKGNEAMLHVWEWAGDLYKLKANYELTRKDGKVKVEGGLGVGSGRLAVKTNGELIYLIDFPSKHAIGAAKCGREMRLHASGKIIECQDILLRASDLQVLADFQGSGSHIASVDSTGSYAVYPSGETANVVKLPSGAPVTNIPGVLHGAEQPFLINANTLMCGKGVLLVDIKTGVPIWRYNVTGEIHTQLLANGQTLLAFTNNNITTFAMADLPDPEAAAALKNAKDERFAILPGVGIEIKGDFATIYGPSADAAKKSTEKAITNAGDKVVPTSPHYVLSVTSAAGKSISQTYEIHRGPFGLNGRFTVDAPSTLVTVALTFDGEEIWKRVMNHQCHGLLSLRDGQSVQDAVNEAAKPNPAFLNGLSLPKYILKGSKPGEEPVALGSSNLDPDGLHPAADAQK